jgi:hypothetical protein
MGPHARHAEGVMMKKHGIATLVLATAIFWVTNASAIGLGVGVILPSGDFKDGYDVGYGAHLVMDYPVTPLASIYGDLGYNGFKAKDNADLEDLDLELPDLTMWNISVGGRAGLGGAFYLGAEIGYYIVSDDLDDEIGITPLIGTKFSKLDLSARYKATDDFKWFEIRAALGF